MDKPVLSNDVFIDKSSINGEGLFSNKSFKKGDVILNNIFPYKPSDEILYEPTHAYLFNKYISKEGTKINHCSKEYNSYVHTDDYKIYQLKANKTILPRDEITCDYDITNKKYPFIAESDPSYNKC